MYLRPGLSVLHCPPDGVQLGTDPRWAVRLTGLDPAQVDAVLALADGPSTSGAQLLDDAVRGALVRAGALVARPAPAADSAVAWSHLLADGDGPGLLAGRSRRCVGILGLGPCGLSLAQRLAACGVGRLVLDDDSPVTHRDLAPGGYGLRDLGQRRSSAAVRCLNAEIGAQGPARVVPAAISGADDLDALVLIVHGAVDPENAWRLMAEQVVHLPVVWGEAGVDVGPLVVPGAGPCLRCVDLHRRDADPRWPAVLAQLSAPRPEGSGEEPLLAHAAANAAAAHVLAALDGRAQPGVAVVVPLPDVVPRRRTWPAHPACGCTDPVRAVPGRDR
ncbi:MAG: ThiF family adenylyltransferase [Cellulomonadaceae bacterium]